jgi:hypothetical protein
MLSTGARSDVTSYVSVTAARRRVCMAVRPSCYLREADLPTVCVPYNGTMHDFMMLAALRDTEQRAQGSI